jgi:hypothetical protein
MSYTRPKKKFAWSYSALTAHRTCPKKYLETYLLKNWPEDESEQQKWGNELHKAMADGIIKGAKLPPTMARFQEWVDNIRKIAGPHVEVRTELKLAFDDKFQAASYFDPQVWFRGIADVLVLIPSHRTAIAIDWKTGKVLNETDQLATMAQCVFANHPSIDTVGTIYAWLGYNTQTVKIFERHNMAAVWNDLWPDVLALKNSYDTDTYPAKPSGLCKRWCPVTTCTYHGKGG